LAGVRDQEANLNRAIAAFREALRVFTFQALPENYAGTQGNLGAPYFELAQSRLGSEAKEEGKDLLRAARQSCNEALRVYTKESHPEQHKRHKEFLDKLDAMLASIK
jgi:hypothetical protein